jgi:predicted nuclease of predicted toxin-antitoxin system
MMVTIVVDEDMHRSVAEPLKQLGYRVLDIRDHGLRGAQDTEVFAFAQRNEAALLTGDLGFSNIAKFPPGSHHGIIVARYPTVMSTQTINREIFKSLMDIEGEEIKGSIIVLSPGQIRIRRP